MDVLIIGLGNSDRGDDGLGLVAAAELESRGAGGVRVARYEGEPTALMELWRGADAVVLIDASNSGAPPGTVHRFEADQAPLPVRHLGRSSHTFRPGTAIELARALGRVPRHLLVYGVEGRCYDLGAALSPEVRAALPGLVERILADLSTLGGERIDA